MILQVEGVVKRFGGLVALNDVYLNIEPGEVVGLIGPNGAGKSTFLNVIAGLYKPESGSVHFDEKDITGLKPQKICQLGVARTFQISLPFPKMTILDNVLVAATFGNNPPVKNPQEWAEEMLDFVDFSVPNNTLAGSLNAGQLRRLDLARALASKPKLLLLDEAAAGLTSNELSDLQTLILKIRDSGVSILIVEHIMQFIMNCCDRIAVLQYGQKIAEGSPADMMSDERVKEAYLGEKYIL